MPSGPEIGQRYGKLVIVAFEKDMPKRAQWECICDCGNTTFVRRDSLNSGNTKSCGCGMVEQAIANALGASQRRRHPFPHARKLKDLFRNMHDRCSNPNNKRWANYGGKGVSVCDEWHDRMNFYNWCNDNGYKPGLQIDRKNVHGDYSSANCRFVDAVVQMNNTTRNYWITYGSKTLTASDWGRKVGLSGSIIRNRIREGWTIHEALTTPRRRSSRASN